MANIQSKEVNLTKRVQTGQGPSDWRFCRVVLTSRGQVRPDLVIVNEKEERHPEGVYYIEWRENRKRSGDLRGEMRRTPTIKDSPKKPN